MVYKENPGTPPIDINLTNNAPFAEMYRAYYEKIGFNGKHPELREGEIFLMNIDHDVWWTEGGFEMHSNQPENKFEILDYKTKRKGGVAYSSDGKEIFGAYPVFIKKEEWEETKKKFEASLDRIKGEQVQIKMLQNIDEAQKVS